LKKNHKGDWPTISEIWLKPINWAVLWLKEAKFKAEQASGFLDAMDYISADIDIKAYQLMLDVEGYFSSI